MSVHTVVPQNLLKQEKIPCINHNWGWGHMIVLRFLSLTLSAYLLALSIMGAFHFTHQLRPKWAFVINFKADLSLGPLTYRLSVGSETPTYPKRPAPQASRSERYSCSQHLLRSTWSEHQNQIMIRFCWMKIQKMMAFLYSEMTSTNRFGPCLLLQIPWWDLFPKKNSPLTRCSKTLDQMKPWKNIILKLFLTCCCLCTTHCCEKRHRRASSA